MLSQNLKVLRKEKGLSQEQLANRLNVVRQTVSKWEKGLSVPDAEMLIRISEIFERSVSELLGVKIEDDTNMSEIAKQLASINEELAIKNRRSKRIWRIVLGVVIAIVIFNIAIILLSAVSYNQFKRIDTTTVGCVLNLFTILYL